MTSAVIYFYNFSFTILTRLPIIKMTTWFKHEKITCIFIYLLTYKLISKKIPWHVVCSFVKTREHFQKMSARSPLFLTDV